MSTVEPLTIIAMATAKPGQEGALRTAQEALVAATVKEPGGLHCMALEHPVF